MLAGKKFIIKKKLSNYVFRDKNIYDYLEIDQDIEIENPEEHHLICNKCENHWSYTCQGCSNRNDKMKKK